MLYIFYLETNGTDGEIDVRTIPNLSEKKFVHSSSEFGLNDDDYKQIFNKSDTGNYLSDNNDEYSLLIKS
jgi:hypothetical protein